MRQISIGKFLVLGLASSCLLWSTAKASPLNLVPLSNVPDFMGSFIGLSYDSTSETFQALGYTTDYANGSVFLQDSGAYTLAATISHSGVLSSGTLTINGDIGGGVTTLLTGDLNAVGSSDIGGDIFEFSFTVTGGDPVVVNDFGGIGANSGGVILIAWFGDGDVPFTGSWASDFNNSGTGSGAADSTLVAVPEPSSISLLLVGSLVCVVARRGFHKHDRGART
jgi:hypothetical protein